MTKQLRDLFTDFLDMSSEEQLEKVRQIRHTRSIERPKTAIKKQKKQAKKDSSSKDKLRAILKNMTPDEQQDFLNKLAKT